MSRWKHSQTLFPASLMLLLPIIVRAEQNCYNLPPPDPGRNFLQNFLSPCYQIRPLEQTGSPRVAGDLNATYGTAFYRVNPRARLSRWPARLGV